MVAARVVKTGQRDVHGSHLFAGEDAYGTRREVAYRYRKPLPAGEDPTDSLSDNDLAEVLAAWAPTRPMSRHLSHAVAAGFHGWTPSRLGEPVPGCDCRTCDPAAYRARRQKEERERLARLAALGERRPVDREGARAVPVYEVAQALGLELHRGRRGPCPIHGGQGPNFSVTATGYRCFSCGASGDGIRLVQTLRGFAFTEAVEFILQRAA